LTTIGASGTSRLPESDFGEPILFQRSALPNRQNLTVEIDVIPAQPAELRGAESGKDSRHD
jgi:hypothetical protein